MKVALKNGELWLADLGSSYQLVKNWRTMRWDRRDKIMKGPASIENLEKLDKIAHGKLPENLKNELQRLKNKMARIDQQRMYEDLVPLTEYPVHATLFKHQIRGANMALLTFDALDNRPPGHKGFGLLFEMGLGKTLTAIAVMGAMYKRGFIQRVLVVAPATVCPVWPGDFKEFAAYPYQISMLMGDKKKRLEALGKLAANPMPGLKVAVINYESTFREGIREALEAWDPDMVICDESQRIKTHSASQSKELHRLGDIARYKLILTGTPIQNNAVDFYSQYRFLDSSIFGTNFYAFKNRYCVMGGYQNHQILTYRFLNELIQKAHSIACRATKIECLDLPEFCYRDIRLEFSRPERRMYDQLRRASIAELESGDKVIAATVLTKILRLQQMTGGFATPEEGRLQQVNHLKLDALSDIIDDYVVDGKKKLVIFARFRAELDAIESLLIIKKVGYGFINGDTPMEDRGSIVDRFQSDAETMVFVAQLQTANFGITLTAASTAVFYSWDYNYANYQQAMARIHRIGQTENCTYIHLVVNDTIDDKVLRALKAKEDIASTLVDNWKSYFE